MECVNTAVASRPWQELYRNVPFTIEPSALTGLDMFRATVRRRHDAALLSLLRTADLGRPMRRDVGRFGGALQRHGVGTGIASRCICRISRKS